MFDEEAKLRSKEWFSNNVDTSTYETPFTERYCYELGFKDGAEFGYNKANELNYVKDGDLPEENKLCLIYLGNEFNPITGWYKCGYWYFEDCRNINLWQEKVIAWKEIVLPKESE